MQFLNEDKRSWDDLTDEEKGKLLLAYYEGKTIQEWWPNENEWEDFSLATDGYIPLRNIDIWRIKPEPVKQVQWCNDYEDGRAVWHRSREAADRTDLMRFASVNRIAVIRREIVDGVVNYYRKDV